MGTAGGANAAGIKYAFQPAAKAADVLGLDKPRNLPILNAREGATSVDASGSSR